MLEYEQSLASITCISVSVRVFNCQCHPKPDIVVTVSTKAKLNLLPTCHTKAVEICHLEICRTDVFGKFDMVPENCEGTKEEEGNIFIKTLLKMTNATFQEKQEILA